MGRKAGSARLPSQTGSERKAGPPFQRAENRAHRCGHGPSSTPDRQATPHPNLAGQRSQHRGHDSGHDVEASRERGVRQSQEVKIQPAVLIPAAPREASGQRDTSPLGHPCT